MTIRDWSLFKTAGVLRDLANGQTNEYNLEHIYIYTRIFFRVVYSGIHYIWKNASINTEKWLRTWSCTDLKTVINSAKSIWKEEMEINCTEYKSGFVLAKLGQAAAQINQNRSKPRTELLGRILYGFKYFFVCRRAYSHRQKLKHPSSLAR